jgi:hypothetical protein
LIFITINQKQALLCASMMQRKAHDFDEISCFPADSGDVYRKKRHTVIANSCCRDAAALASTPGFTAATQFARERPPLPSSQTTASASIGAVFREARDDTCRG